MERTNQSSRKCEKQKNMASNDRLSALPDDILCHILSFLPTKESVATSTLSGRWRFVWAYVPNLEFIKTEFLDNDRFINIVNSVMSLYKVQSMNTFSLCAERYVDLAYNVGSCTKSAIAHNPKNLYLSFLWGEVIPPCLFTCKTLVDLKLDCCEIHYSYDIYLPALKKLHLEYVRLAKSNESLPRLISGCPVLEELICDNCLEFDPDMVRCCISSPSIRRLMLLFKDYSFPAAYHLKIDTPALRYLQLDDRVSSIFSVGVLDSLVEADINLDCYRMDELPYSHSVIEFVGRLCNVKCLKFSSWLLKVPSLSLFPLINIKFSNLTKLELAVDWHFISYFLENAHNLEVLIIRQVNSDRKCWTEPLQVPKCLLSHLRSVRIDQFECTKHEFDMVSYLLRNAKVLQRMEIIHSLQEETGLEAKLRELKTMLMFERGSHECYVFFH